MLAAATQCRSELNRPEVNLIDAELIPVQPIEPLLTEDTLYNGRPQVRYWLIVCSRVERIVFHRVVVLPGDAGDDRDDDGQARPVPPEWAKAAAAARDRSLCPRAPRSARPAAPASARPGHSPARRTEGRGT